MNRQGGKIRWVAVKGYADDFSFYVGSSILSEKFIAKYGDKISSINVIQRVTKFPYEVMQKYRP
jgi:hypothetical protein